MATDPVFGLGLCAGGHGLELGVEAALDSIGREYRTVCVVEREASVSGRMATRVLEGSLAEFAQWDDLRTFDARRWSGIIDIVTAGFPCQPFSVAGKQKRTDDDRWIWPDIARILRELLDDQPDDLFVFLENVPGLLNDGGDTDRWEVEDSADDALGGMATVLRDLADLGLDAEWDRFSAADAGANHGRKRIFILAYRAGARRLGGIEEPIADRSDASSDGRGSVEPERERSGVVYTEGLDGRRELEESGTGSGRTGPSGTIEPVADTGDGQLQESRRRSSGRDGSRPASPLLAEPAVEGPSLGRDASGLRESATAERGGSQVGDAEARGRRERGEPSERIGQPDGTDPALEHADDRGPSGTPRATLTGRATTDGASASLEHTARAGEPGRERESGRIGRRGVREAGEQLPGFAFGPADERWAEVLLRFPWLRPSYAQAEAESDLRDMADGLAALVAHERTGALRALGNGVVPLQAAFAFIVLARRAGLIL